MSGPTPTGGTTDRSWEARPLAARMIRVVVLLGPISVGCAAAVGANRLLPVVSSIAPAIGRGLGIVVVSTAVVWAVDRLARRLLPLAALMQLSLVFPDQAPSRFRSALKSGSSRRLERTLEETRRDGLSADPGDAARQVVQLIGAIGDHDRRTRGHSERVRLFADLVGEELKLSKEERQKLQWGALLHDLGKLMVPSEILNKKGRPDEDEWRILQGHPAAGMALIEPLADFLGEWAHAIGGHHEKWDGSGYPSGLSGSDIPRAAAIVAVADSFEVMTAVRSYKKAMPLADARAELTRCAGTHFSPEVVRAFLSISLGHLRIVSGPLAALAHLPFLGNIAQLPGAVSAAVPSLAGAAAIPAAAVVTAAALTVGTPMPRADALEEAQSAAFASDVTAPVEAARDSGGGAGTGSGAASGGDADGSRESVPTTTSTGSTDDGAIVAAVVGSTTTAPSLSTSGAGDDVAPATVTTSAVPTPTTTQPRAATTVAPAPIVTAATTTAPPATAAPPTTAAAPPSGPQHKIMVSTNNLRVPGQDLNGTTFPRGTSVYVYMAGWFEEVEYTYPGGQRSSENFPFDMMGTTVIAANAYRLPSTPGTYTITAEAESSSYGQGSGTTTVVATFTVT